MTRRSALASLASLLGAGATAKLAGLPSPLGAEDASAQGDSPHSTHDTLSSGSAHAGFPQGRQTVDPRVNGFDPSELARDFDLGRTSRLPDGRTLREWDLVAIDKEIEVAPGVKFAAWTYNGRVPGPTLRAREGDLLRVHFTNSGSHPHTIHFHGIHRDVMDGVPGVGEEVGGGLIEPDRSFTYEFDAAPFGFHHYHCHTSPLAQHIHKGLYGGFIVDPKQGRPPADELVLVQNGFDTNFDGSNEVYAVNTVAFHYPIDRSRSSADSSSGSTC